MKRNDNENFKWFIDSYTGLANDEFAAIGQFMIGFAYLDYRLEQTIWKMAGHNGATGSKITDQLRTKQRIKYLSTLVGGSGWDYLQESFDAFNELAEGLLEFRNAIGHGFPFDEWTHNDSTFRGEVRKHPAKSFSLSTENLRAAHSCLWRALDFTVFIEYAKGIASPDEVMDLGQKLKSAVIAIGEVNNLDTYNPTFEKY